MSTSDKATEADWAGKADIVKKSFKEVLASDKHEDGKAQRIMTAMAFLTAAAGLIFAELSQVGIGTSLKFPIFSSYAYIPVCFFAFVVTMLIGTLFFLAALGPAFNVPKLWRKKDKKSYPRSLLFSQLILQGTQEEWKKHWEEHGVDDLQVEIAKNYMTEAYLLAEKVNFKVRNMSFGKLFYKLSLGFLGLLVVPVFTTHVNQVHNWAAGIFLVVLIQDLVERKMSPGGSLFSGSNLVLTLFELGAVGCLITIIGITNLFG